MLDIIRFSVLGVPRGGDPLSVNVMRRRRSRSSKPGTLGRMTSAPNIFDPKDPRWFMDLEDVPETHLHAAVIQLLWLVLAHRFPTALVTSNLPCRWDPTDERIGVDPDVVLIEPAPPTTANGNVESLRIWEDGHSPPKLAIEVVSKSNADKDYRDGPARHERLGTKELWLFDPELRGPTLDGTGGPHTLQIWRGRERLYAGDGPACSPILDAWLVVTTGDGQPRLRISDDSEGTRLWPTLAEAEAQARRAEAQARQVEAQVRESEARRADAEASRADAAEAELRRLRALLEDKR